MTTWISWWLNNGITIVADKVQLANKVLELESPQIVNGLQTSTEIYKGSAASRRSDRGVLIKVIEASDATSRDRIIQATNSQTSFGPSALKATDYAQRRVEEYLKDHGFFYERRRRQYQNMNKPLESIVSIDQMGQAVLAALVQCPHIARGSITRVYDNEIYPHLFNSSHPLDMYLASLQLFRSCRTFLLKYPNLRPHVEDFQFHLTSVAAIFLTRKDKPGAHDIAALLPVAPQDDELLPLLNVVQNAYKRGASGRNLVLFDQLAKSPEVAESVLQAGRNKMRSSSRLG